MNPDAPICVMDATCALCSWGARMIHRFNKKGDIRICPIQTDRGKALLHSHGLDTLDPDSWLFIANGEAFHNFDAVIRLGEYCGGIGRVTSGLRLIPHRLRNRLYYWIARNRYKLFGRGDMCALPDPKFRARLME